MSPVEHQGPTKDQSMITKVFFGGLGGGDTHRKGGNLSKNFPNWYFIRGGDLVASSIPPQAAENNGSGIQRAMAHGPHEVQGGKGPYHWRPEKFWGWNLKMSWTCSMHHQYIDRYMIYNLSISSIPLWPKARENSHVVSTRMVWSGGRNVESEGFVWIQRLSDPCISRLPHLGGYRCATRAWSPWGIGVASGIKETQLFMETSRAAMEHSHISCSVCQCAYVLYITRYLQRDAMHPIQADFIKTAFERRTKQTSFRHAAFRSITGYLHETVLLYESTLSLPRIATKIVWLASSPEASTDNGVAVRADRVPGLSHQGAMCLKDDAMEADFWTSRLWR